MNNDKPFLVGYRKFVVALWWMLLATFGVAMVLFGWAPRRAGAEALVQTLLWCAGFFCSVFVGGNAVEHFRKGWQFRSQTNLSQEDSHSVQHVIQEFRQPPTDAIAGLSDHD